MAASEKYENINREENENIAKTYRKQKRRRISWRKKRRGEKQHQQRQ
jgi:hypothetical protein